MDWIVDVAGLVILLGITYALMGEGILGAVLMFFNVIFSGLIALNFYEPLADLMASNVPSGFGAFSDTICLMGLFLVALILFRLTTDTLAPQMIRVPTALYHLGRIAFGGLTGLAVIGFVFLGFHAAPVDKQLFSSVDYKTKPIFEMGLDYAWLSFMQYASGYVFTNDLEFPIDPYQEFGNARVFDPEGDWLVRAYEARPFGDDTKLHVTEQPAASEGQGDGEASSE